MVRVYLSGDGVASRGRPARASRHRPLNDGTPTSAHRPGGDVDIDLGIGIGTIDLGFYIGREVDLGFYNPHGALVLILPPAAVDGLRAHLAAELATGEALGPRVTSGARGGTVAAARVLRGVSADPPRTAGS